MWEKLIAALGLPTLWLASIEWRLRTKINDNLCKERCGNLEKRLDEIKEEVKEQGDRIIKFMTENHLRE